MQQVADEVLLDHEVAVVDVHDERQRVHVLERRALRRALEVSVHTIAEPGHRRQRPPLRDLLDREVELVAGDELDRGRGAQRALALDGHVGADETDPQPRILALERLGDADVVGERRRAGVEHGQLVAARNRSASRIRSRDTGRSAPNPRTLRRPSTMTGLRPEYHSRAPEFSIGPSWARTSSGPACRATLQARSLTARLLVTTPSERVTPGIVASIVAPTMRTPRLRRRPGDPASVITAAMASAHSPNVTAALKKTGRNSSQEGTGGGNPAAALFIVATSVTSITLVRSCAPPPIQMTPHPRAAAVKKTRCAASRRRPPWSSQPRAASSATPNDAGSP